MERKPDMKHVRSMSKAHVSQAQMTPSDIIGLVATILSTLAAVMTTLAPLIGDK